MTKIDDILDKELLQAVMDSKKVERFPIAQTAIKIKQALLTDLLSLPELQDEKEDEYPLDLFLRARNRTRQEIKQAIMGYMVGGENNG
jgi:hypothetical protein